MSEGKRTPGPWVFVEDAEGLGIPMVYSEATQAMVAITDSDLLFADAPADEQEANARLIAAAPSLLMALEEMLRFQMAVWRIETDGVFMARAAIRKAKGE